MKGSTIVNAISARMQFSRISFQTSMTGRYGQVIPLGVMAEILAGEVDGLCLFARPALDENEVARVGRVIRDRLRTPFDYLREDFNWAWQHAARGRRLEELAEKYPLALRFAPPTHRRLVIKNFDELLDAVRSRLSAECEKEFKAFLDGHHSEKPLRELEVLPRAA
jgi:hypothetical protein